LLPADGRRLPADGSWRVADRVHSSHDRAMRRSRDGRTDRGAQTVRRTVRTFPSRRIARCRTSRCRSRWRRLCSGTPVIALPLFATRLPVKGSKDPARGRSSELFFFPPASEENPLRRSPERVARVSQEIRSRRLRPGPFADPSPSRILTCRCVSPRRAPVRSGLHGV
jgi:hypothetical protein